MNIEKENPNGILYGLRREEILGLTWNAIDFKNKSITIRKTVGRGKYDGVTQFLIKDIPKNKSSYRTLPMFDFIADLLKKYKEKYKSNEKILGNTHITDYKDFICLMDNGELVKPDYVDRIFSKILKENGFRHIRLHDLRHSCATLLLRNGVPLPEIQKWLGHSNIITTQRYSHLDQLELTINELQLGTLTSFSYNRNSVGKSHKSFGCIFQIDIIKPYGIKIPLHTLQDVIGLPTTIICRDNFILFANNQFSMFRTTIVTHSSTIVTYNLCHIFFLLA